MNHTQIPVNRPKVEVNSFHRDGFMRVDGNFGSLVHYNPNSYGVYDEDKRGEEPPVGSTGPIDHFDFREDDDNYYEQPGKLFRLMSPAQQQVLYENTARNMEGTTEQVKKRHIRHCYLADPDYGKGVASALGIDIDTVDMDDLYGARG